MKIKLKLKWWLVFSEGGNEMKKFNTCIFIWQLQYSEIYKAILLGGEYENNMYNYYFVSLIHIVQ